MHQEQYPFELSNNPIIVGLDIGTTKIAVVAGRKNMNDKIDIIGFGHAPSAGVEHGLVRNINRTVQSVLKAMGVLKINQQQLVIADVYVGIAGSHICSMQMRGDMVRQDPETEITEIELIQLINDQKKTYVPAGKEIIKVIPQEYFIDNITTVKDIIGHIGVRMGANFHVITGDIQAIKLMKRSVEQCELKINDLVLQPIASAVAVMNENDAETGVVVLDIGGGTSDLVVFHDSILRHTAVIPLGGENITKDIKKGLGITMLQAEVIKINYGSALVDEATANAYITIPALNEGMPAREISIKNLSEIIRARMTEILEFVCYNLKQANIDMTALNGGIIITGGGSQLKHLKQLTEYVTGLTARVGYPHVQLAPNPYMKELNKPIYSTVIGLILQGCIDYSFYKNIKTENRLINLQEESVPPATSIATPTEVTEKTENVPSHKVEDTGAEKQPQSKKASAFIKIYNNFKGLFKDQIIDLFNEEKDTQM